MTIGLSISGVQNGAISVKSNIDRLIWTIIAIVSIQFLSPVCAEDWTRFRGANGSGIAASANLPETWSESENVSWSIELPGPGSSSPIIVGDKVLVTCYTGYGLDAAKPGNPGDLKRHLICYDIATGKELWLATVEAEKDEDAWEGFILEHGFASSTPATDGERIYMACGKTGLAAFDMNGNRLWLKSMGTESDPAKWGDGSSPIVWKNLVIMNAGNTGNMIIAFDSESGVEAWRKEDKSLTNCWSTPIIVEVDGHEELVCAAPGRIFALDPEKGTELWTAVSPIAQTVCASLVFDDKTVFLMGGRQGAAIGIRCGGSGDVSETHTIWKAPLRSGIGTPVIVDGRMYWTSSGIAYCASCETGAVVFQERIEFPKVAGESGEQKGPRGDYASPIAVGNRILVINRGGQAQWLEASEEYSPVGGGMFASDPGSFNGTPAVGNDSLFIRSNTRLYCIAKGGKKKVD